MEDGGFVCIFLSPQEGKVALASLFLSLFLSFSLSLFLSFSLLHLLTVPSSDQKDLIFALIHHLFSLGFTWGFLHLMKNTIITFPYFVHVPVFYQKISFHEMYFFPISTVFVIDSLIFFPHLFHTFSLFSQKRSGLSPPSPPDFLLHFFFRTKQRGFSPFLPTGARKQGVFPALLLPVCHLP